MFASILRLLTSTIIDNYIATAWLGQRARDK